MPNKKLLLVDDEPELLEILEIILKANFDLDIETAEDGLIAIDKIKSNTYDAIFCDFTLAGANGMEVFQVNKSNNNHPFIIMSGENIRTNENYQMFVDSNPANHYLEKPCFEADIVSSIEKLASDLEESDSTLEEYSKINI
jgi:DNA-binding NtrC family response regulator